MNSSARLFHFLGVLLLALAPWADAQVSAQAQISPASISVGDPATLTVQIRGATSLTEEPTFSVDGLEIIAAGTSHQSFSINGRTTIIVNLNYQVRSEKTGDYVIPEVEINLGNGQKVKTNPVTLKVVEQSQMPDIYSPLMQLSVAKNQIWEGEVVPLTISVLAHQDTSPVEIGFPQIPRDNFAMKRFQRNPDQSISEMNGDAYRVFNYRTTVSPVKAGQFVLGPAETKVEMLVPDGSGRRDPFGGLGMRQRSFRPKSNTVMMTVKPLPAEGRPAAFSGAVGNFQMVAQAQQTKVQVGDPISVTVQVTGVGNFETLVPPTLENSDGFRLYDSKQVAENRSSGLEPGAVAYNQVLMPEKELKQIPAYILTFFNPESGQYSTVKTPAIPIQVTPNPNRQPEASNAPGAVARDFASSGKNAPTESMEQVLSVRRTPPAWQDLPVTVAAAVNPGAAPWLLHGIPGAALLAMLAWGAAKRWNSRQQDRPRRTEAPPRPADILRQLRAERSSLRKFYGTAADFLTAWQSEKQQSLPADGPAANAVQRIRQRRDFYCYGSAEADQPVPESEHHEILEALKQF